MKSERGVTLIELLIAVSLMALLSTGMLMALRLGMTSMEKTTERLYDNRRLMSVNRIIDSEIAGIVANKTHCMASGTMADEISFFQGEPQTMRFVSTFSLDDAARGYPKILEFQVIPGEKDGVRLIVNESIYAGPLSTGRFCFGLRANPLLEGRPAPVFLPVATGSQSFVLADKLAYCRMSFKEDLPEAPFERWWPVWGKEVLPSAIRIEMAPLPSERMRLPLTTITAPVHVTRDVRMTYDSY
jgi:prepilin-type N-terminal cleavage/methylation domain-containing protein